MSIYNIVAYLLTDGGIDSKGRIYFASTSGVPIEDFKTEVMETFNKQKFSFTTATAARVIRFSSSNVREKLLSLSPSYRTRPCNVHPICPKLKSNKRTLNCICEKRRNNYPPTQIPDEIMNGNKEIKREFLKRVFTADGGPVFTQ